MGCTSSRLLTVSNPDVYMDSAGKMHLFNPQEHVKHDAKAELAFVSSRDASEVKGGQEMYLISKTWVQQWVAFVRGEVPSFNERIDNSLLVDQLHPDRYRATARFKHDYRLVSKPVWEYYFQNYGGGPVLCIIVPSGYSKEEYKKGDWLASLNLTAAVVVTHPVHSEEECLQIAGTNSNGRCDGASTKTDLLAKENASIISQSLVNDFASRRDAAAEEALAKAELERKTQIIATVFSDSMANAKFKQAKVLENAAKSAAWSPKGILPAFGKSKTAAAAASLARKGEGKMEEFAAILVQNRWRMLKAKKWLAQLRQQRQLLREQAAATMVQSRWRIKLSRRRLRKLHDEKAIRMQQIQLQRNHLATVIAKNIRRLLAIRRYQKLQLDANPYFLKMRFISASGIKVGDIISSDPYIIAAGTIEGKRLPGTYAETFTTSVYTTRVIHKTLNPVWDESGYIVNLKGTSASIVLTLFDKDPAKSDFLGQNILRVSDYLGQFRRKNEVDLNIRIEGYQVPVKLVDGSGLRLTNIQVAGKGTLHIQMSLPPFAYSMCGWVDRLSREVLGSIWKRRYFVLCDNHIQYFDHVEHMEVVKNRIDCNDITSIIPEVVAGHSCYVITYGAKAEKWTVKFADDESLARVEMWKRKISRCCPKATIDWSIKPVTGNEGGGGRRTSILGGRLTTATTTSSTSSTASSTASTAGVGAGVRSVSSVL